MTEISREEFVKHRLEQMGVYNVLLETALGEAYNTVVNGNFIILDCESWQRIKTLMNEVDKNILKLKSDLVEYRSRFKSEHETEEFQTMINFIDQFVNGFEELNKNVTE